MTKFEKVYRAYMSIETEEDLKRNNLTLAAHEDLYVVLWSLNNRHKSNTMMSDVAKWCEKHGLIVTKEEDGIGWTIERDE